MRLRLPAIRNPLLRQELPWLIGEGVLLLQGHADLRFSDPDATCHLGPGDMLWIPPQRRHRVERTDPGAGCLWLTLFIDPDLAPSGVLLDPA